MTRDEVERLLEKAVLSLEKRMAAAQQAQQVELAQHAPQQQQQQQQQQQRGVVKSLKPLAEGQPLEGPAAGAAAAAANAAAGALANGASAVEAAGGSMQRIRSLSQLQQHMHAAYQDGSDSDASTHGAAAGAAQQHSNDGTGGSHAGSHEGTRHSHVSWADEVGGSLHAAGA